MTTLRTVRHLLSSPTMTAACNLLAALSLLTSVGTAGVQYRAARCQAAYNAAATEAWRQRDAAAMAERVALDGVVAAAGEVGTSLEAARDDYDDARRVANDLRRRYPIPAVPHC